MTLQQQIDFENWLRDFEESYDVEILKSLENIIQICPICAGLKEYDKAELYNSDEPVIEACDSCNGEGYLID